MVLKLSSLGGGSSVGFNVDIGASGNTTTPLGQTYPAGGYSITSQLSDASMDIYAIAADGTLAGYTGTKALTTSKDFDTIVIFGATNNDLLSFEYKSTVSPASSGDEVSAGPFITSSSTYYLSIDESTVISGGNFAAGIEVYFTRSGQSDLIAKSVVRSSNTELIVTRPDIMNNGVYSIKLINPGVDSPSSTNSNILQNSMFSGAYADSGGVITESGGYRIHKFTSSSTINFTRTGNVEYLVVAGGGGGGWDVGGGGGAGGLLNNSLLISSTGSKVVTVGAGGAGAQTNASQNNGSNSAFDSVTSVGGGGGGNWNNNAATSDGASGGSGGGAGGWSQTALPGSGTSGQGYDGGSQAGSGTGWTGSGGGGATGAGSNNINNTYGYVNGGPGLSSSIGGSSVTYSTGGKGGGDQWTGSANGSSNTGSGGDGAGASIGSNGGSGIVIIRYQI